MRRPERLALILVVIALAPLTGPRRPAHAQPAPRQSPPQQLAPQQPTTRPNLAQLDAELRSLYGQVDAGTVRVLLPNVWVARLQPDHPLNKWGAQLTEEMKRELLDQLRRDVAVRVEVDPAGPAGDAPAADAAEAGDAATTRPAREGVRATVEDPDDPTRVVTLPALNDVAEQIGLLFGDAGHVLVPAYLDPRQFADHVYRVKVGDELVRARFIGADRTTQLTVLQLEHPAAAGAPLPLAGDRPELGQLVLMLAHTGRTAQLECWTGGDDRHAVVVDLDGRVAGFVRAGQMLTGAAVRPLVEQIIRLGEVDRAVLGAYIGEVPIGDPARRQVARLGARPALRVLELVPDAPARGAGVREGDLILAVAGEPVTDITTFAATIATRHGPTELQLLRGDEPLTITVDLQPQR